MTVAIGDDVQPADTPEVGAVVDVPDSDHEADDDLEIDRDLD
jgi:hypothetical protein